MDTIETIRKNNMYGKTVLDIGCGDGSISKYMAEKGHDVDAIDPDKKELNIPNVTFFNTTLEEYKADKKYDVVIARLVIHLIPRDTKTSIDMITQHARPGGYVYFTTFGEEDPWFGKQAGGGTTIKEVDDFIEKKGYRVLEKTEHKFNAPTYSGKLKPWHIIEYAVQV